MDLDPETPCVIEATWHDWRTVKGRKMLQLVFEIPIEKQGEVLTLLGHPEPSGSKWCMIALKAPVKPAQARVTEKPERSLAERCAILCSDVRFLRWISESWGVRPTLSPAAADRALKDRLGIDSKTELNEDAPNFNAEAAANFKLLLMTYDAHRADQEYADVRR